ncbi:DUF1036 domain-containing protein [bacterium]|nr:DUF1036 domain-containing protein [bacterium]
MRYFRHLMTTAAVASAVMAASPALASNDLASTDTSLNLCNRHDEKIFVSVAYDESGTAGAPKVFARGWWGIDSGACTKLTFPLLDDRIMLFAQSSSQILNWIGDYSICVDLTHAFDIHDATTVACDGPDQRFRAFRVLTVANLPSPAPDNVPVFEFKTPDATRVGGGLKFCNDTTNPLYVSYSQKKARDQKFGVDGWYEVQPSKCHEENRDPVADEVWFYAQGGDGTMAWRGDTPLCTDDVKGYFYEDAANMPCTDNNQMMQMFQKATLTGQEFEHHFTVADAHKVRSMVDICNNRQEKIVVATAWKRPEFPEDIVTRGWYLIDPGKCATGLSVDSPVVYVHAESESRVNLLQREGQIQACVNNTLAFLFSRGNSMACGAQGLLNAVFVPYEIAAGQARVDINAAP